MTRHAILRFKNMSEADWDQIQVRSSHRSLHEWRSF